MASWESLQGSQGVLAALALQLLIYGLGWAVAGQLVPGVRATTRHWTLFSLTGMVAMGLTAARGSAPDWLAVDGGDWVMLLTLSLMRRGSEIFFAQDRRDREHLAMLLLMALLLIGLRVAQAPAALRVSLVTLLLAWVSLRAVLCAHGPMRAEFGPRLAWALHGPALLFWVTVLGSAAWAMVQQHVPSPDSFSVPLVLAILAVAAALHLSYAGMLVLRLVRQLRHLSRHDPLTGLLNRRAMDEQMARCWRGLPREPQPLSLLALDIDHFKHINDSHGHAAGDAVLVALARCLRETLRPHDELARTGGEEFLVLLPGTTSQEAGVVAQRLCERIAELALPLPAGGTLRFTASVGVASQTAAAPLSSAALWSSADAALYRAKQLGRNRVVVSA